MSNGYVKDIHHQGSWKGHEAGIEYGHQYERKIYDKGPGCWNCWNIVLQCRRPAREEKSDVDENASSSSRVSTSELPSVSKGYKRECETIESDEEEQEGESLASDDSWSIDSAYGELLEDMISDDNCYDCELYMNRWRTGVDNDEQSLLRDWECHMEKFHHEL
jgi:hypothetical protein